MTLLFILSRTGEKILNLDNIEVIEFDKSSQTPSLDFWTKSGTVLRYKLRPNATNATEYAVMNRLKTAMKPLYEGRVAQIMAYAVVLDLTEFEDNEVKF